jgi:hypothetical protein
MLKKLVKENRQRLCYQTQWNNPSIADYYERNLIAPLNWTPMFNTAGAAAIGVNPPTDIQVQGPKAYLSSVLSRFTVTMESSGELVVGRPVDYAVFFVTPKQGNARQTLVRTGGIASLTKNTDYTAQFMLNGVPAMWDLNPAIYTTKAVRRGTVATHVTSEAQDEGEALVTNTKDNRQRHAVRIFHKRTLTNGGVYNPDPSWKSTTDGNAEPNNRLYMVMFHNAATGQAISMCAKHEFTGYVPI